MITNYYHNLNSKMLTYDLSALLLKYYGNQPPIIICLGTDKLLCDMVGVFVADMLKKVNLPTYVFGGNDRCVNNCMAKILAKSIKNKKILFIDSAALNRRDTILFSNVTKLNDGTILNIPSINCGTIFKNNKIYLHSIAYNKVLKYSKMVSNAVCDYFSYINLIKSHQWFIC